MPEPQDSSARPEPARPGGSATSSGGPRRSGGATRVVALILVGLMVASGVFFLVRSFQPRPGEENVASAPAGGRTQAQADTAASDPLVPGIPESPDVPADAIHAGVPSAGERIRRTVLADGEVGDDEVPGWDLTGLTAPQREWLLAQAVSQTCTCGCRQDLLECRRDDATCPVSPARAESLVAVARTR